MRPAVCWVVTLVGCGRIGFDPGEAADAAPVHDDLCGGSTIDENGNGIPDPCDPCAAPAPPPDCTAVGVSIDGVPNHAERVWLVATNALRADPVGFRDAYIEFGDASSSEVFPTDPGPRPLLHYRRTSNTGGRFHATDRVGCDRVAMPDGNALCDGTSYLIWAAPYQPINLFTFHDVGSTPWWPELPFRVFGALVCGGGIVDGTYPVQCTPDFPSARIALLGLPYGQQGFGVAYDGVGYSFWDVMFTNDAPAYPYPAPIGGHFIYRGLLHFALGVETTAPPAAVYVVIDGARAGMTVTLGTPTRGMYALTNAVGAGCRSYYFLLVESGSQIWRYPGTGVLRTTGDAGCTEE